MLRQPDPRARFGRKEAGLPHSFKELNKLVSTISRVVVYPKYRGIGLGRKIVEETLPLAGTRYVELIAVMAKYKPFSEKAGMKRIKEQGGNKQAWNIADGLSSSGFNIQMLANESYVRKKLATLDHADVHKIRQVFVKNPVLRFMKYFRTGWGVTYTGKPYGKARSKYVENINAAV